MSNINPIETQIILLRKGITRRHLKRRFRVKDAAISMALTGRRPTLLAKIYRYAKSHKPRKAA